MLLFVAGGPTIGKGKEKKVNVNEQIRASQVRVISDEGQMGVLPIEAALREALNRGLDLVEVSPNAEPPVCRIMDYGKYKYQLNKRKQEAKKKQSTIQIKEVKLRTKTEANDIKTKVKHLLRFVEEGNKVKISVIYSGREITHPELGVAVINKVMEEVQDSVAIEAQPRMEGRALVMMVGPKAEK